ncbi:DEAD/DEAH box helicase [Herminiimonas contaminans]|uniref:DEAD/DEAH box helicase n=1 Tax=Herminiimonas contaminans TaxID=1111140 RepID=A0ABS0EU67_9BURK|nr:DEAD/DEAH box helicase [Herminiimonas contaminans]MBF8178389.1 DEAD/DEAH box helicase [Herminiimonas contaminans]
MSQSQSTSFDLLDERIRRWIWNEQWTELRDAQEQAVPAIINADRDVIIAAATAAGKTEAAFLPILTAMLSSDTMGLTLYISPLKALINDQFSRLERLCEALEIPVWPWHGDISGSLKTKFLKHPEGVLLITPESLEAMLCNRGFAVPRIFADLRYVVVDELHAFIGSERGKQLQSLMQRIDSAVDRKTPRIGLSATLGDMQLAADFLRSDQLRPVHIIQSKSEGGDLRILVKGFIELASPDDDDEKEKTKVVESVSSHLYKVLRGSNNLVFPNSRAKVERYTYALRQMCEANNVPNEFWPHHGSLSREIREETEAALKNKELHTTAVCTNTLELGIDIGSVKSIVQIGPAPSVASLRQRLGRSGRRKGEPAILRGFVIESELTANSHLMDELRLDVFELCAMVSLLLDNWFEPPKTDGLHLSTLVQQLLSLIAQKGGITAVNAYSALCINGPFNNINKSDFVALLRHLATKDLIQQDSAGVLLHGQKGELIVNHYAFYASFATEEEFRVITGSRTLGSIPLSNTISVGDFILFAARTWKIEQIDEDQKTIFVHHHVTGRPPSFNDHGGMVHDHVRERMKALYESGDAIQWVDTVAADLLDQGRVAFLRHALRSRVLTQAGRNVLIFTWLGDMANEAIASMLKLRGFNANCFGPAIEVFNAEVDRVADTLLEFSNEPMLDPIVLLHGAYNLRQEKWDWALPDDLLQKSFASLRLNIVVAHKWLVTNRSTILHALN